MKRKYFKSRIIIQLPGKDDHVKEEQFIEDYLKHSHLKALGKFEKDCKLIKSGVLLKNLEDPTYEKAVIKAELVLVLFGDGTEKEVVTRTSDQPNLDIAYEDKLLYREKLAIHRELKVGHVRHQVPIKDVWYYQIERTVKKPEINEETEIERFELFHYGDFEKTFHEMSNCFYWEANEIASFDPEYGESLTLRKFLIQNQSDKELKILLVENKIIYPLDRAITEEIEDKEYIERVAACNRKEGPLFAKNEVVYNIEPEFRKKQIELEGPRIRFTINISLGDRNNCDFLKKVDYHFQDTGGEDLFVKEREAKKFYKKVYNDLTSGNNPSQVLELREDQDLLIQAIRFSYQVDDQEQIHHLCDPNTLDRNQTGDLLLQQIKQQRREKLTELNQHSMEDYETIEDKLEVLKGIDKQYIVFTGNTFSYIVRQRHFFHHDLQTARSAAIYFYLEAIEEEINSPSPEPVSIILVDLDLFHKDTEPFYIDSTDPARAEYIELGRETEKEIFARYGFKLYYPDTE